VAQLLFLLLLTGAGLIVLLWVGTLFLQGYIYTEPAEQLSWRAPAAGAAILAFYAVWCLFEANSSGSQAKSDLVIPLLFSPREDMAEVKRIWVVRQPPKGGKETVEEYKLKKVAGAVGSQSEYVEAKVDPKPWNPEGVVAILIDKDGEKDRFERQPGSEGGNLQYKDSQGWVLTAFGRNLSSQPTRFRMDWLLGNLVLNLLHIGVWFICLWLLLRFQWPHALGLAVVLWLVVSFTIVPYLLSQARSLASRPPPARQKTAAFPPRRPPSFV
jgi:hypothetical protein